MPFFKRIRGMLNHLPLLLLCVAPWAFALPVVEIKPASSSVVDGSTMDIEVVISGASDLYAFQFDLAFDPALLNATATNEGAFLSAVGGTNFFSGLMDNSLGVISFVSASLIGPIPGASGSGVLASITFDAIGIGQSALTLANRVFLDSSLIDLAEVTSQGATVTIVREVGAIPEPTTLYLVVLSLAGLFVLRQKIGIIV